MLDDDDVRKLLLLLPEEESWSSPSEQAPSVVDGMRHATAEWKFPEHLPCAWERYADEGDLAAKVASAAANGLEAIVVTGRVSALAALGLSARKPFPRADYLWAKGNVDRVSRGKDVMRCLVENLPEGDVRVLDVGAGTLQMVEHVTTCVVKYAKKELKSYVAVDVDEELLRKDQSEKLKHVQRVVADVFEYQPPDGEPFSLVVANSFADLASPARVAELFQKLVPENALLYLPTTFAGKTWLEPPLSKADGELLSDDRIFQQYHDCLALSGQFFDVDVLKAALDDAGFDLLKEDVSDWHVPLGTRFATYLAHFVASALVPTFLADRTPDDRLSDDALRGLRWTRAFRAETWDDSFSPYLPRTLCVYNADLLFRRRPPAS